MEVTGLLKNGILKKKMRTDVRFLALLLLGWGSFVAAVEPYGLTPQSLSLGFAAGAALLSFLMLGAFGYLDNYRLSPLPRKSDLFLILAAVPLAGVCQHFLCGIFFSEAVGAWGCLRCILIWSPAVAVGVFMLHTFTSRLFLRAGRKRRIAIDLTPSEKAGLLEIVENLDIGDSVEVIGREELKAAVEAGLGDDIDLIVISRGTAGPVEEDALLLRSHLCGISIVDYKTLCSKVSGKINLSDLDLCSYVLGATRQTLFMRAFLRVKAIIEPLLAVLLAVLLSPSMLALAVLIKLTSKGPVLYAQVRTGYMGRRFVLYKFRSMRIDAEANGPQWSSANDPRVTPLGKFMRATRLDELPQLWNVIHGDMSFIGPRPERPEIYDQLKSQIPLFWLRTVVRPGITGWAQVCAGYAASVAESQIKLEHDLFYIQHLSPRLDLIILLKTLQVALFGDKQPKKKLVIPANVAVKTS